MFVDEIKTGTVIDHITAGKGKKVYDILGIGENYPYKVALVMNVPSKTREKKDILKIEDVFLSDVQINLISLVAKDATINIIEDSQVKEKKKAILPNKIVGVGKCANVNCITNFESAAENHFDKESSKYKCLYCERLFSPEDLVK